MQLSHAINLKGRFFSLGDDANEDESESRKWEVTHSVLKEMRLDTARPNAMDVDTFYSLFCKLRAKGLSFKARDRARGKRRQSREEPSESSDEE